jgi:hypothetical protein
MSPGTIFYLGKPAVFVVYAGNNEAASFCIVISKELAEDIYAMKTDYDLDVLAKGVVDGWLAIWMNPTIFADTTNRHRLLQGVKILKRTAPRPTGFFACKIVPKRRTR